MNASRRQRIQQIRLKLEELSSEIETVIDDEQSAYDNLPESLQSADLPGSRMLDAISELEAARDCINDATSQLETAAT